MVKKSEFDYDLIVIGSGAGGSVAATIAASEGKRVAIVESDVFGGESPNFSDVPINALLTVVNIFDEAKHSSKFGLRTTTIGYNYPSIRAWKELAVKRTGAGGNRRYYENRGISAFNGTAHFISPNEISVNRRHLSSHYFLVATGSKWIIPNIPGLNLIKYYTPHTIFETTHPPKSLLIIGGGDTSVEIAHIMSIFGTKIYIVEQEKRLLPCRDKEVGEVIERVLNDQKGVTTLTSSKVVSIEKDGLSKRVIIARAGVEKSVKVDEVLVAAGRIPATDLGLENAGVKYSASKGIAVNEFLQTNIDHIFAAGDVIGHNCHTHTALFESQVVANNMFHRNKIVIDYLATPSVLFINPGVASVGLSEADCIKRKIKATAAVAPLSIVARSNTADFNDGFVKIIANNRGIIVGASIVAPGAAEIIQELVIAIRYKMSAKQLSTTPHAFLSWSEAIRVAAGKLS